MYILGSSARLARAEAYDNILRYYIMGLYYGIILQDNITGSYYRFISGDNITG